MKKIILLITFLFFLIIFNVIYHDHTFASFKINPDFIEAEVKSGNNKIGSIEIGNNSEEIVHFKIIIAGYGHDLNGNTQILEPDTNPLSCVNYIEVNPEDFYIEPGKDQVINLSATIPDGIQGGRYAVLMAVTVPDQDIPVSTVSRLGVPIRLTIKNSNLIKTGKILETGIKNMESNKPLELITIFQNDGNIHYKVQSYSRIYNSTGEIIGTVYSNSGNVLPGYSRELISQWVPGIKLEKNVYTIATKVISENGYEIASKIWTFEIGNEYVPPPPPASITLKPAEAAALHTDDGRIFIDFPRGAVLGETVVSLRSYSPEQVPAPPAGYRVGATCFRVDGLTGLLAKEAKITVKYSSADLEKAGGDPARLRLARWDEAEGRWTILKTGLDKNTQTLTADTSRFSIWAVMADARSASGFNWRLLSTIGLIVVLVVIGVLLVTGRKKKQN